MSNIVDVGTPPDDMDDWKSTVVRFHGFDSLSARRDESVDSPEFSCFGHQWTLKLYPRGLANSSESYVSFGLYNMSNKSIEIQWSYSIRSLPSLIYRKPKTHLFGVLGSDSNAHFYKNFAERSDLMLLLIKEGSLFIEVRMKALTSTAKSITQFIPTNPFNKHVSKLFMDEETADVVFEVGGQQQGKDKHKRAKISTNNFHAHRLILKKCAPTLYEMCGKSDESEGITISITDVKPRIFKHMLSYVYGGKLSVQVLKTNAKDIIDACDKYGVVHLKLEAEACYVKSTEITMDNMMDNLLYADSKNLALLKEVVMDHIINNKTSIIGKVSFDKFPSHLVTDLLTAMARGEEQTGDSGEDESAKYVKMRVGTLRKMLDEKGLDVDGSRESMIALLREHSKPVKSPINPFGTFGSQKPS